VGDAYFHVDHSRFLSAGQTIPVRPRPDVADVELAACLDRLFPGGFGNFGYWYLFAPGEELWLTEDKARAMGMADGDAAEALGRSRNRLIEVIWELTRLHFFPDRPSRLYSVFGYRDLDAARVARAEDFRSDDAPIWLVEAADAFDCDSAWLDLSGDVMTVMGRSRAYWSGERHPDNLPSDQETLLVPPVTVLGPAHADVELA
jgi:hypothetical protein